MQHQLTLEVAELVEVRVVHRGRFARREASRWMDAAVLELDGEVGVVVAVRDAVVHERFEHLDAEAAARERDVAQIGHRRGMGTSSMFL